MQTSSQDLSRSDAEVLLQGYDEYLQWLDETLGAPADRPPCGNESSVADEPGRPLAEQALEAQRAAAPFPREPGQRFRLFDASPEFVVLPLGTVQLGAHPSDPDAQPSERPRRRVQLGRPIAMALAPLTFEQWDACLADDGTRHHPGDATWGRGSRPVMNVSWHDAEEYCGWLSRKSGLHCRLPSEAEWEHAFWAGQAQGERFPWGQDLGFRQLRHHAWFAENSGLRTQPVGQLKANAWGLVDMLGNVAEWVADAHHTDLSLVPADASAYAGPPRPASRVIKGGSWLESARTVRPSARDHFHPDYRGYRVGFRVVVELPEMDDFKGGASR